MTRRGLGWLRDVVARASLFRSVLAGAMAAGAALYLARELGEVQPLKDWLFFDIAPIWGWQALLSAACVSVGHALLGRLVPEHELPPSTRLALSFPLGLVVFVLCMYAGGALGLYGPVFGVALPVLLLGAGAGPGLRALRRARDTVSPRTPAPLPMVLAFLGALPLGLLYLGLFSPDAVNYDASWMHLTIAQDYAREGRIVPFRGDWVKNVPHLGSLVSTWAFLVPGLREPPLRWMAALHGEFTVLCWTLVGLAATVRFLAERDVRAGWTAFFLFPGIFVYDSNLGGAADHFLALFACPLLLVTARLWRSVDVRTAVLWGLLAGAAHLTKVQAFYFVAPLALALGLRFAWLLVRPMPAPTEPDGASARRRVLLTALTAGGVALSTFAPHLIRNAIFFRNPFYPFMQDVVAGTRPRPPADVALQIQYLFVDWRWRPPKELGLRVKEAVELLATFAFVPHYSFVGPIPTFGQLFTLSLPLLPFAGRARRLWGAAAVGVFAVFAWAMTYRVDRNLQTFMPLLAAVTGAVLVRVWHAGKLAAAGVALLVTLQMAWSADLWFSGWDRMSAAASLIRSSIDRRAESRWAGFRRSFIELGKSLPRDATVLWHNDHVTLGVDRRILLDWIGFQGLVDYRGFRTARDVWTRFRKVGVSHVVYVEKPRPAPSIQETVLFDVFSRIYGGHKTWFGGYNVFEMPESPPEQAPYRVMMVGVPGYGNGIYPIESLGNCDAYPPELQSGAAPERPHAVSAADLDDVDAVLLGGLAGVQPALNDAVSREFRPVSSYDTFRLFYRQRVAPP